MKALTWLYDNVGAVLLFLILFAFCCSCGRHVPAIVQQPTPDSAVSVQTIGIDSAFTEHFAHLRATQTVEAVQCLYGIMRGDTALIAFARPAKSLQATGSWVYFESCPTPRTDVFGELTYLGTWHAHVGGIDCGYSDPDTRSFYADNRSKIELVSCSGGLISRVK